MGRWPPSSSRFTGHHHVPETSIATGVYADNCVRSHAGADAGAGGRSRASSRCGRLDVHHLIKRAQGGSDFDLDQLIALCRRCHDQTDAPYERGRLIVTALGGDQFRFDIVKRVARERTERDFCPRG